MSTLLKFEKVFSLPQQSDFFFLTNKTTVVPQLLLCTRLNTWAYFGTKVLKQSAVHFTPSIGYKWRRSDSVKEPWCDFFSSFSVMTCWCFECKWQFSFPSSTTLALAAVVLCTLTEVAEASLAIFCVCKWASAHLCTYVHALYLPFEIAVCTISQWGRFLCRNIFCYVSFRVSYHCFVSCRLFLLFSCSFLSHCRNRRCRLLSSVEMMLWRNW